MSSVPEAARPLCRDRLPPTPVSRRVSRPKRPARVERGQFSGNPRMCLRLVFDIGLWAVAAGGSFGVPLAVGGFILDRFGTPRHALFVGGAPGGGQRGCMCREAFRKHTVDGIGPAAIVLDDLVNDMAHRKLACCWRGAGLRGVNAAAIL